jgi:hypothetical protein
MQKAKHTTSVLWNFEMAKSMHDVVPYKITKVLLIFIFASLGLNEKFGVSSLLPKKKYCRRRTRKMAQIESGQTVER